MKQYLGITWLKLGPNHIIKEFNLINFQPIRDYLNIQKEISKNETKDQKEKKKQDKLNIQLKYGFALVDNHIEKVKKRIQYSLVIIWLSPRVYLEGGESTQKQVK